jgi:hypothetical protein
MPIHQKITEAEYNALPGLRNSAIKGVLESPAVYKHGLDNPSTAKHFTIGSAVHSLLLEEGKTVVHVPVDNWKTKDAQERRDAALADGKYPLNNAEHEQAQAMAARLRTDPDVAKHLRAGQTEVTLTGHHEDTFTPIKARLDILDVEARVIMDPKTTATADRDAFGTTAYRHGYYMQAPHYIDLAAQATDTDPAEWRFLFAVISKSAPYQMFVTELDEDALALGRRDRDRGIDLYLECQRTGKWPDFPGQAGVTTTSLPRWALLS